MTDKRKHRRMAILCAAAWVGLLAFPVWAADREMSRGPVTIEANRLGYDEGRQTYHAEGDVLILFPDGQLKADYCDFNEASKEAAAQGNVVLQSQKDVLEGRRLLYHVDQRTGTVYDGRIYMDQNHLYLRGKKIEKTGEATYRFTEASATTCDGEAPDWHVTGKEVNVTIDGYGTIQGGTFHAGKVPVLYLPYMVFPAKTRRQSGFLVPYISYSQDKDGIDVELPFYWAISPAMDATLYQRYIEKRGFKEGAEFRYYAGRDSSGILYGDYLYDTKKVNETSGAIQRDWQSGQHRWSLYWNHETTFDPSAYVRADIAKVSDPWYFKDFHAKNYYRDHYATDESRRFSKISFLGDESLASLSSAVRFVKNWSLYNLTALVVSTDDFTTPNNRSTLQRYPEIVFSGIKRPLFGTPLNLEFTTSYDYFYREEGQRGHLADLQPVLSVPHNFGDYLQVSPWFAYKGTFWNRDDNLSATTGTQGSRNLYNTGISATTEFYRIFEIGGGSLEKIKHAIRPEVSYGYTPDVKQTDLPDFVGQIGESNAITYAVTTTLTAKIRQAGSQTVRQGGERPTSLAPPAPDNLPQPATGDQDRPAASTAPPAQKENHIYREFLRLKLAQNYDIKESTRDVDATGGSPKRPFSEVSLELDVNPFQYASFSARNVVNVYTGIWTQTNYDLYLSDWRGDSATIGYRYTYNAIEEVNLALRAKIFQNIDATYVHRRNLLDKKSIENTFGVTFRRQCWAVDVSYSETETDKRYMISVNLLGLGRVFGF